MADLNAPATPQKFNFANQDLVGVLVNFTGRNRRRHVVHEFVNRRGARVEDKEQGPATLEAQLEFLGDDCAAQYQRFKASVADNPFGLLVHPIGGRYWAFCQGPDESINFSVAINQISVRCSWIESELDSQTPRDVPNVGNQAQVCTAWKLEMQRAIAAYMGVIATADTFKATVLDGVQAAIDAIDSFATPLDDMRSAIADTVGIGSQVMGKVVSLQLKGQALSDAVDSYVSSATDLYNGSDVQAGAANASATSLGAVSAAAQDLEDTLIATSPTPAGSADAFGAVEETHAACLLLDEAVKAAKPRLIVYTTTEIINVVVLAQRLYGKDAGERAAEIMGLNHIPNPAAIPAGTVLLIYER